MLYFHEQIDETRQMFSDNPGQKLKSEKQAAEKEGHHEKARLIGIKMDSLKALEGYGVGHPFMRPGMYLPSSRIHGANG